MSAKKMEYNEVVEELGMGVYQILIFCLITIFTSVLNATELLIFPFVFGTPKHWCQVDHLANLTVAQKQYISAPTDSKGGYDSCAYFDIAYEELSDEEMEGWERDRWSNSSTLPCQQWGYDHTQYTHTLSMEWDLVCDKSWMIPFVYTAGGIGDLISHFTAAVFSDRFGRRLPLIVFSLLHLLTSSAIVFAPTYTIYVVVRGVSAFATSAAYTTGYVYMMELAGTQVRACLGMMHFMSWSVGVMLAACAGYVIRDSFHLQVFIAACYCVLFPFYWFVMESPRWLAATGKKEKAVKVLLKIAAVNGKYLPEDLQIEVKQDDQEEQTFMSSLKQIGQSSTLVQRLMMLYVAWITVKLMYYGLTLNVGTLSGSIYLNTFITGAVEIPGIAVCLCLMQRVGRRATICTTFIISAASCLAMIFLQGSEEFAWLHTSLAMLGKACIAGSFGCIYNYTIELFPTPVRQFTLGSSSFVGGMLGGFAAPYMGKTMMSVWLPLPSVIFGSCALLSGMFIFLMPETLGRNLPDTVEEAESLTRTISKHKNSVLNITYVKVKDQCNGVDKQNVPWKRDESCCMNGTEGKIASDNFQNLTSV